MELLCRPWAFRASLFVKKVEAIVKHARMKNFERFLIRVDIAEKDKRNLAKEDKEKKNKSEKVSSETKKG